MKPMSLRNLALVIAGPWSKVGLTLWVGCSFLGLGAVWNFKAAPAPRIDGPSSWPVDSALSLSGEKPTAVLFLHPRCPCSRATIEELGALLTEAPDRAWVHVVFFTPEDQTEEWARTDVWNSVGAIPGVNVGVDPGARDARRFGASTSGHLFVFDIEGRLRFSGGITGARGHAGDNPGRRAAIDLLLTGRGRNETGPVFGCALYGTGEVTP